ncbi:MAG: LamG domain-containing protein, partial [Candidatus Kariarchaeaceae archaeon]
QHGFKTPYSGWFLQGITSTGKLQWGIAYNDGSNKAATTDSYFGLLDNTWHHIVGTYDGNYLRLYIDGKLSATPTSYNGAGTWKNTRDVIIGRSWRGGSPSSPGRYFDGIIDEVAIYNRRLTFDEIQYIYENGPISNLYNGSIKSKNIEIPDKMCWDTLKINKSEVTNSLYNITILDADSNLPILPFQKLSDNTIDISSINPIVHNNIKVQAILDVNSSEEAILYDWSINWTMNRPPKIVDYSPGTIINRTHSFNIKLNLSDHDESEQNLSLLAYYKAPSDIDWKTDYLTDLNYNIDHWNCTFTPPANAELGYYEFRFFCNDSFQAFNYSQNPTYIKVVNNNPIIWEITTSDILVNRTHSLYISIDASDVEIPSNELDIFVGYKSPEDISWNYIPNQNFVFQNGLWETVFTPLPSSILGSYIFNVTCNDSDNEVHKTFNIIIINNKPFKPEVSITPSYPVTSDNINSIVSNILDIETSSINLKKWYRWYKNNEYQPTFDNETSIPNSATVKDEEWKCRVYLFDGDDLGPPGEAEVTVQNSPPTLKEDFDNLIMQEDNPIILQNKLSMIFDDLDNDTLVFKAEGQVNIDIQIIQSNGTLILTPMENWFGTEFITLYANDTFSSAAEEQLQIVVEPTNDLPRIVQVGTQIVSGIDEELQFVVKQDNWLNLSIIVEDIDGDV